MRTMQPSEPISAFVALVKMATYEARLVVIKQFVQSLKGVSTSATSGDGDISPFDVCI